MPNIVLYTTPYCPYCLRAKGLLNRKGVEYSEIRVDLDVDRYGEIVDRSRRETVPQIFIDDYHVGGFDNLCALDGRSQLDPLLGLA